MSGNCAHDWDWDALFVKADAVLDRLRIIGETMPFPVEPKVAREYSVIYNNGHRVPLRDRKHAEQMSKLTSRGRVEWRTAWQPFDGHPSSCDCLICDPDTEPDRV